MSKTFEDGNEYSDIFVVPAGPIAAIALVAIEGATLILQDIFLYPLTGKPLQIESAEAFSLLRFVSTKAIEDGFSLITLEGYRKKPGQPARMMSVSRKLR